MRFSKKATQTNYKSKSIFYTTFFIILITQVNLLDLNFIVSEKPNKFEYDEEFLIDVPIKENQLRERQMLIPILFQNNQTVNLVVDTGSSILWVYSENCYECKENGLSVFDTSLSETFVKTSNSKVLVYGNSQYFGLESQDYLSLNGINIAFPMKFYTVDIFGKSKFSGIVGFGKGKEGEDSFIKKLKDYKVIDKEFFVIHFLSKKNGVIHIGEYPFDINDENKLEEMQRNKCNLRENETHWKCLVNKIIYDGFEINQNKEFHIDTGATTSLVSKRLLWEIYTKIFQKFAGCKYLDAQFQRSSIVCIDIDISKLKEIKINIESKGLITIKPYNYMRQLKNNEYIFEMIGINSHINILGIPFLIENYMIFDNENKSISFIRNEIDCKTILNGEKSDICVRINEKQLSFEEIYKFISNKDSISIEDVKLNSNIYNINLYDFIEFIKTKKTHASLNKERIFNNIMNIYFYRISIGLINNVTAFDIANYVLK